MLLHKNHLVPHQKVASVAAIDFNQLHKSGIRYIVFDKDNTLTAPYKR
jgi:phosphatidylglycerophosphatase GEP4